VSECPLPELPIIIIIITLELDHHASQVQDARCHHRLELQRFGSERPRSR
jgi:hypothetical protein